MAEIVSLNRARKAKARVNDKAKAVENRAAHGRTKAQKTETQAERALLDHNLDGAKRQD